MTIHLGVWFWGLGFREEDDGDEEDVLNSSQTFILAVSERPCEGKRAGIGQGTDFLCRSSFATKRQEMASKPSCC